MTRGPSARTVIALLGALLVLLHVTHSEISEFTCSRMLTKQTQRLSFTTPQGHAFPCNSICDVPSFDCRSSFHSVFYMSKPDHLPHKLRLRYQYRYLRTPASESMRNHEIQLNGHVLLTQMAVEDATKSCFGGNCNELVYETNDSALLETFWNTDEYADQFVDLVRPSAPVLNVSSHIDNLCSTGVTMELCWRNIHHPIVTVSMEHLGVDGNHATYLTEEQKLVAPLTFEEGSNLVVKNRIVNPTENALMHRVRYKLSYSQYDYLYASHEIILPPGVDNTTYGTCSFENNMPVCVVFGLPANTHADIHITLKPKESKWGSSEITASIDVEEAVNSVTDSSLISGKYTVYMFTPKWKTFDDTTTADVSATGLRNPFKGVLPVADGVKVKVPLIEEGTSEFVLQISGYANCLMMHFGADEKTTDFTRRISVTDDAGIRTGFTGLIIDPEDLKPYQNEHVHVKCVGGSFFSSTTDLKLRMHKLNIATEPSGTFNLNVPEGEPRYFKFKFDKLPEIDSLSQIVNITFTGDSAIRSYDVQASVHVGTKAPHFFEDSVKTVTSYPQSYKGIYEAHTYPFNATLNSYYVMYQIKQCDALECKYKVTSTVTKPAELTFGTKSTVTLDSGLKFFYVDIPVAGSADSKVMTFNAVRTKGNIQTIRGGAQRDSLPWWNDYKSSSRRLIAQEVFDGGKKYIRSTLPTSLTTQRISDKERTYFFLSAECSWESTECNPEVEVFLGTQQVVQNPVVISGKKTVRSFNANTGVDVLGIEMPKSGSQRIRSGIMQVSVVPQTTGTLRPIVRVARSLDGIMRAGDAEIDTSQAYTTTKLNVTAYYAVDESGQVHFLEMLSKNIPSTRFVSSEKDDVLVLGEEESVSGIIPVVTSPHGTTPRDISSGDSIFLSVSASCEPGTETCKGNIEYELGADAEPMEELKFGRTIPVRGRSLFAHVYKVNLSEMLRELKKKDSNADSVRLELFLSAKVSLPNLNYAVYMAPSFESAVKKQGVPFTSNRDIIKKTMSVYHDYSANENNRREANADDVRYLAAFLTCQETSLQTCFAHDFDITSYKTGETRPDPVVPTPPGPDVPDGKGLAAGIIIATLVITLLPFILIASVFLCFGCVALCAVNVLALFLCCLCCGAGFLTVRDRRRYKKMKKEQGGALLKNQFGDNQEDLMAQHMPRYVPPPGAALPPHMPPLGPAPAYFAPRPAALNDDKSTPDGSTAPPKSDGATSDTESETAVKPNADQVAPPSGAAPPQAHPPPFGAQPPPPQMYRPQPPQVPKSFTEHVNDLMQQIGNAFQPSMTVTTGPSITVGSTVGSTSAINSISEANRRMNENNRRMHETHMRNHQTTMNNIRQNNENVARINQQHTANIHRQNAAVHQRIHTMNMQNHNQNMMRMNQSMHQNHMRNMNMGRPFA